ncbi:hypothetical protein [Streptomyces sp. NPDC089795]|uniref:hypothetical protein n=1 Tax=Streptomyces sp. NPDC089795 TaxID=3155297 RepID=UPI00342FAC65
MAALAALVLLLFVGLRQLDEGLGRIEAPGYPVATIGPLLVPGSDSRTAWCVWANGLGDVMTSPTTQAAPQSRVDNCLQSFTANPDKPMQPVGQWRLLLWAYAGLDLVFAIGYAALLRSGLQALRGRQEPPSSEPFAGALYRATRNARVRLLVYGLVGAELIESACIAILASSPVTPRNIDILYWMAMLFGVVKWLLLVVATVVILLLAWRRRPQGIQWRQDVRALRLQLGVTAVLLLLLSGVGTDQVQDSLLGLLDHRLVGIPTLAGVVVLALLLWRSVHRSALVDDRILDPVRGRMALYAGVVIAALAGWWWVNLHALAVILIAVWLLTWLASAGPDDAGDAAARDTLRVRKEQRLSHQRRLRDAARLLAALPPLVLAVFVVRAVTVSAVVGPRRGYAVALLLCSVLVAGVGVFTPYFLRWAEMRKRWSIALPPRARRGGNGLYVGLAIGCVLFAGLCVWSLWGDGSWSVPAMVGPVLVATVFLCVVLVVLNELQHWSGRATPMAGFRLFGLQQTPVFALVLMWAVLAAVFDPARHHEVRITASDASPPEYDLSTEFRRWAAANCASAPSRHSKASASDEPVPLVIVAASGGGVRAAYWTSAVLGAIFPPGPAEAANGCETADGRAPVFAVSAVSGGSLGAVSWISRHKTLPPAKAADHKGVFGHDHLSSTLAWMLYFDVPRSFVGFNHKDRAAVLEQSWERRQAELADDFYTERPVNEVWRPIALLNGTAVQSGCRVLASAVQLGGFDQPPSPTSCLRRPEDAAHGEVDTRRSPALIDLQGTFLCGKQNIRLSTAALLSARFPWVSPSGRFIKSDCATHAVHPLSVVDGGYIDGTGSLTAVDLLRQLQRDIDCHNAVADHNSKTSADSQCDLAGTTPTRVIKPVILQIDNGYTSKAGTRPDDHTHELLVPLQSVLGSRTGALEAIARQRAFSAVECGRYLRIANLRGPGPHAPLGWSLSLTAQEELDRQITRLAPSGTLLTLHSRLQQERARQKCPADSR